jgi:nucleotide-binding universal stress UspA family protein
MFRKILCATDFSPGADHALRVAIRLANDAGAELVVAHAWHVPALAFAGEVPYTGDLLDDMEGASKRALARAREHAVVLGAHRVSATFMSGMPWERICAYAGDDPAIDLVVTGTHGRTGLRRMLVGSVAEKIIRHAPCSVLAVRGGRDGTNVFQHVLCPVDFSESSRFATELAAHLATRDGIGLTLLHAFDLPVALVGALPPHMTISVDRQATELLHQWADDLRRKTSLPIDVRVVPGGAASQVIKALEETITYDLAAVGTHGRTGVPRIVLGSVAEKVVRHAPCPVLVARRRPGRQT